MIAKLKSRVRPQFKGILVKDDQGQLTSQRAVLSTEDVVKLIDWLDDTFNEEEKNELHK